LYGKPCRHAQPHTNHKPIPINTESSSLRLESDSTFIRSLKKKGKRKEKVEEQFSSLVVY
jgi:hypothetical protein